MNKMVTLAVRKFCFNSWDLAKRRGVAEGFRMPCINIIKDDIFMGPGMKPMLNDGGVYW